MSDLAAPAPGEERSRGSGLRFHDDGWGLRARLGILCVHNNPIPEGEWWAMAHAVGGVSIHASRVRLAPWEGVVDRQKVLDFALGDDVVNGATMLGQGPLTAMAYLMTSTTAVGGADFDGELVAKLTDLAGGIPVTTSLGASVVAVQRLGIRRLGVFTPPWFNDELQAKQIAYWDAVDGVEVAHPHRFSHAGTYMQMPPEVGFEAVMRQRAALRAADVDGIYLAGNGIRSIGMVAALESALDLPVVTANQATFWYCLRTSGVDLDAPGYGILMSHGLELLPGAAQP